MLYFIAFLQADYLVMHGHIAVSSFFSKKKPNASEYCGGGQSQIARRYNRSERHVPKLPKAYICIKNISLATKQATPKNTV